jgi:DNA-binding transcriptional ArsR family regulator
VSKHLRVLREAGIVAVERDTGNDARRQLYAVPEPFVVTVGVLDFGFCLLRFGYGNPSTSSG